MFPASPLLAPALVCARVKSSGNQKKMLSSYVVRFFRLPPLRNTAASFVCPATLVPLRSTGAAPDERQRLQGQPLSWLLARSGLSWPPPYPLSGSRSSQLFVGCSRAPLVLRPCLVARPAVSLSER